MWFCASTITTVGYGDMVPSTSAGRAVSIAMCVFGVVLLCLMSNCVNHSLTMSEKGKAAVEVFELHRSLNKLESLGSEGEEGRRRARKVEIRQDDVEGRVERRLDKLEKMIGKLDVFVRESRIRET